MREKEARLQKKKERQERNLQHQTSQQSSCISMVYGCCSPLHAYGIWSLWYENTHGPTILDPYLTWKLHCYTNRQINNIPGFKIPTSVENHRNILQAAAAKRQEREDVTSSHSSHVSNFNKTRASPTTPEPVMGSPNLTAKLGPSRQTPSLMGNPVRLPPANPSYVLNSRLGQAINLNSSNLTHDTLRIRRETHNLHDRFKSESTYYSVISRALVKHNNQLSSQPYWSP